MDYRDWILVEEISVTVIAVANNTSSDDDYIDLLVERVTGPGAVILRLDANGDILANGKYANLGQDNAAYCVIFDDVAEAASPDKSPYDSPPVGFQINLKSE